MANAASAHEQTTYKPIMMRSH